GIRDFHVTGVQTCALPIFSTSTGKALHVSFAPGRTGDQPAYVTDYTKLHGHTGWRATTSVAETLSKMQRWLQNEPALVQETPGRSEERRVGKECRARRGRE